MEFGVAIAPVNGFIILLLGHGAAQLYNCLQRVAEILQTQTIKNLQHTS